MGCNNTAIVQLLTAVKQKIRKLRKAEKSRKKRWQIKKARSSFSANPYQTGKDILSPKSFKSLKIDQQSLDDHKEKCLRDPFLNLPFHPLQGLPPKPPIVKPFLSRFVSDGDFIKLLNSRRNSSAPGINAIPYKVYKKCTKLSSFLFKIFKSCFANGIIPIQWRCANEIYIPKSSDPNESNLSEFRPIALLNVEGKLFFSLISKRIENHLVTNNKFINQSVQKGCMEKVPGCWEHISMVWSALKEARSSKKTLASIWLDIANAYGSIPHRLIFLALERYGISDKWINLVKNYYYGLYSKAFSQNSPSNWHKHERGIFAGCTLSIILFLSGMNIIIEYSLNSNIPSFELKDINMPLLRAFMDDLNIMSSTVAGAQSLLSRCTTALNWAHMEFRPNKSRSIVLVKGRSVNSSPFYVTPPEDPTDFSNFIPSIQSKPIKFLGRVIDCSISDRKALHELQEKLFLGLKYINKSFLSGIQKLWVLQHLLIPRIQWPLLIYEVPISFATKLEQRISVYIRNWLKLNKTISSLAFYSKASPCRLPIKSLTSVLKAAKISGHLLLRDSADEKVSQCAPTLESGSWKVNEAVQWAESEIDLRILSGKPNYGGEGLGFSKTKEFIAKDSTHDYRKQVSDCFIGIDDSYSISKAVQLQVQGQWTRWLNYVQNDFSWNSLLATPPNLLSFCLSATYDTLPSPRNLERWHISTESSCFLCSKPVCTTAHVLGACKVALTQGRFTFRHDSVLRKLFEVLKDFIQKLKDSIVTKTKASRDNHLRNFFVKSNAKIHKEKRKPNQGVLHLSSDWIIISDLDNQYCFPSHIALTELRPDIVIYSNKLKKVLLIELTCPCEENMSQWHDTKFFKYQSLKSVIEANGWSVDIFAIEVGARGFCSRTVPAALKYMGLKRKVVKSVCSSLAKISMECSFCIWIARNSRLWSPGKKIENSQHNLSEKATPSSYFRRDIRKSTPDSSDVIQVGFVNKGNTCYANSILQVFSVLPILWNFALAHSSKISPLLKSISLNMALKKRSVKPVDPSNFLWALQRHMISLNNTNFNFNTQQDAHEILQVILNEIKSSSPIADDIFSSTIKSTTTCNTCFSYTYSEDKHDILSIPTSSDVSAALKSFLMPETLSGSNKWFCSMCNNYSESTKETAIISSGSILILQLMRFNCHEGVTFKDEKLVDCLGKAPFILTVPQTPTDEVTFSNRYSLIATINHSGSLTTGHYWAYTKVSKSDWYSCNDKAVIPINEQVLKNKTAYVLFFERI